MILASHGLIASQIASFDADALAFFARVTAAGGTLTTTEKTAVNQLVIDLKANGTWTPMKAIYPMVGSSAAACAQNLKSSSFTGTFTSGWTFASTGVTPNGTSAFMKTQIIPNSNLQVNSTHLSYYSRTNVNLAQVEIGCDTPYTIIEIRTANKTYALINTSTILDVSDLNSIGFYVANRTSVNVMNLFKNNSKIQNTTTASTGLSNNMITIGAMSTQPNGNTNSFYSTKECAFASIGDGLTDTQASNFYTAVQTFQTTLSRNV